MIHTAKWNVATLLEACNIEHTINFVSHCFFRKNKNFHNFITAGSIITFHIIAAKNPDYIVWHHIRTKVFNQFLNIAGNLEFIFIPLNWKAKTNCRTFIVQSKNISNNMMNTLKWEKLIVTIKPPNLCLHRHFNLVVKTSYNVTASSMYNFSLTCTKCKCKWFTDANPPGLLKPMRNCRSLKP